MNSDILEIIADQKQLNEKVNELAGKLTVTTRENL